MGAPDGGKPWTPHEDGRLATMMAEGRSIREMATALNRSYDATKMRVRTLRQREGTAGTAPPTHEATGLTINEAAGTADLSRTTHRPVRTLDELIAVCDIDTTVWEVETWTANTWESAAKQADGSLVAKTLYQVKAKLRRILVTPHAVAAGILDALRAKVKPLRPALYRPTASGYLYVATFGEPHLGKRAWAPETGEDYDLQIALDRVRQSHRHLMARARALRPNGWR